MSKNLGKMICALVIALATFSTGCQTSGGANASVAKPQVGEMVVFKMAKSEFGSSYTGEFYLEAKVQKIDGNTYEVMRNDNNLHKVDIAGIYAYPKQGSKIDVKVGDFVVAHLTDRAWKGGKVMNVSDSEIEIHPVWKEERTIKRSFDKVIKVSPTDTEDIKKAYENRASN